MTTSPRRPRSSRNRTVVPARPFVSSTRVAAFALSLALVAVGLGWRLVDLQLTPDAALAGEIGSQVRGESLEASRGDIVDRHGRSIALSLPRPSVTADPRLVPEADVDMIVARLGPLLSTEPLVLDERLRRDKAFVYLERQVDPEVGEAVLALGLPGISLEQEQRREHPNGACSGIAVVGRVDIDQVGVSGLEEAYDELLTGEAGYVVRQTQRGGDVQIPGGFQVVEAVAPGVDLQLTLDRNIQYEAEQLLIEALEQTGAGTAIAIVSDPMTGEIFAMANAVRDTESGLARCTTANLGATWTYEPGSIMKPLTFSAVFDHGAWGTTTPVDVPQALEVEREEGVRNHVYHDAGIPYGETVLHSPARVLERSSNTGTILLAQALGPDGLHETFVDFGLGSRTALDFRGESSGILDDLDSHSLLLSNAAIGQSVAVTPLQMIQAYNTIANGGVRVDPVLVMDEVGAGERVRVISDATAATVLRMMRGVVTDGTGTRGSVPGYLVAAKTGTAWQPCSVEFGYYCDDDLTRHYTASFAGIVENDQGPALSVIVIIDDPQGTEYGGGTIAAPVFADLSSFALRQLRVPPSTGGAPVDERVRATPAAAPIVSLDVADTSLETTETTTG